MTGFHHLAPGTTEQAWADASWLTTLAPLPVPVAGDRLLVVAAHPDDETLGAGGLLARCARSQVDVTVVVATDGTASHPDSPTVGPLELAGRRRAEVSAAVEILAPGSRLHFLGLPDGQLAEHTDALYAQLEYLARGATHVITPWRYDRHPDHEACAAAAAVVTANSGACHWQYPVWAWHWDDPATPSLPTTMRRLNLTDDEADTKRRGLACHISQHAPLSDEPGDEAILPSTMTAHFTRGFETFITDTTRDASLAQYFDDLYAADDDPWGLQERFYESRKRALLLAALPRPRFCRAFEPGCSIGLLTEQLATRCEEVIAWDRSGRAVELAARRVGARRGVQLRRARIPEQWPVGALDLIVVSEVGYYCPNLDHLVEKVEASLSADGVLVACHWRRPAPDHPHTADAVHTALGAGLSTLAVHVEDDFVLHVWTRTARSVAQHDHFIP